MRSALAALGRPVPEPESLRWVIGPPIRTTFRNLLGGGDVEEAVRLYRAAYAAGGLFDAKPYAGMREALSALREDGIRLFICTAKAVPFALRVVDHFGFGDLFDDVHGAELDGRFEDKGDLITHILATRNIAVADACMVGDRKHDIVAATRNGIASLGVLWGYGERQELIDAKATALCPRPADLPGSVASLWRHGV